MLYSPYYFNLTKLPRNARVNGVKTSTTHHFSTSALRIKQWPFLKHEMTKFFRTQEGQSELRALPYEIQAYEWPRYYRQEILKAQGFIPAVIYKYGSYKKFCLRIDEIHQLAFEEQDGHISMFFRARPFNVKFKDHTDLCVIDFVNAHPVDKEIKFLKFSRHFPGKITTLEIPCNLIGLLACPAYIKGYQVELALNKIKCEIAGSHFPLPIRIDVSQLKYEEPFSAIYLNDLMKYLPEDGSVRFHPSYDINHTEIVWAYQPGTLPERKLPPDWIDPNFLNRFGSRLNLTYKGYWPKQS